MQIKLGKKPETEAVESRSEGEVKKAGITATTVRSVWLIEAAVAMLTSLVAIVVASVF